MTSGYILCFVANILHTLFIPALFCIVFIAFIWALLLYVLAGDYDEHMRDLAKALMIWSIVFFLVMVIVWGVAISVFDALGIQQGLCNALPTR